VKLLTHFFLLISLSGLTGAAIVGHRTPDLTDVSEVGNPLEVNDIADVLAQAVIKRSAPLEITESDLNQFLEASLIGRQKGKTGELVTFEKALVDLEQGVARITLCWLTHGHRTTSSLDLQIGVVDGKHRIEILRGAYGRMPVARGFLLPILPAFRSLATACDVEVKSILNMTKIQILKDKLVLDPRF
jgi:hypothetical protein